MMGWQWHKLDHMQIICTSFQTDNHTGTSSLSFFWGGQILFLITSQQCQSIEGYQTFEFINKSTKQKLM